MLCLLDDIEIKKLGIIVRLIVIFNFLYFMNIMSVLNVFIGFFISLIN